MLCRCLACYYCPAASTFDTTKRIRHLISKARCCGSSIFVDLTLSWRIKLLIIEQLTKCCVLKLNSAVARTNGAVCWPENLRYLLNSDGTLCLGCIRQQNGTNRLNITAKPDSLYCIIYHTAHLSEFTPCKGITRISNTVDAFSIFAAGIPQLSHLKGGLLCCSRKCFHHFSW